MAANIHQTVMISNKESGADQGPRWLVQLYPLDLEQSRIELPNHSTVLGRSVDCDIHLDDDSVSRRHAEIRPTEMGYEIIDLGSTNGIQVNDQPVRQHPLRSGDRIRMGQRIFRFLSDCDAENQYHETVYSMMTRDGLTSVFNKRYLLECLDREVARCQRYQRPLGVILLDIDHFKSINDTHGHLVGDCVLRELASRLNSTLRGDEVLARFGGEEFAVVVPESSIDAALEIGERCRSVIAAEPFVTEVGPIDVTISVGVASPEPCQVPDRDTILSLADARLYDAKRNGRNQVQG
ncbi:MAG: GGDEF domain-containing protein [Pirellulaceae bacterium]